MTTRKSHSSIDEPEVKSLVDDLLEANATYKDIINAVLMESGKVITTSSLSRYRQHWAARKASEEAMGQQLDRLTDLLKENPEMDLKQGAMGLLWKKLIQRMSAVDATFDDADMLEMGHLLIKATRLGQTKDQLDLQRERLELVRQKVQAAAAEVERMGRAQNLDDATIKKIREQIYGIVPAAA